MSDAAELLATVVGQDVDVDDDGVFRIVRKVATDRVISTSPQYALTGRAPLSRYLELPGLVIPLIYVLREASAEGEGVPRWAEVGGHGLWFYYHEEHQVPHVAVRGEHRATVRLEDGEVLAGHLPAKLHRSVRRLLAEHRDEAYAAWEATRRQEPPDRLA